MLIYQEPVEVCIRQLLISPGIILVFSVCVLISNLVYVFQNREEKRTRKLKKRIGLHVSAVVAVIVFQVFLLGSYYRGVRLLFDNAKEYEFETGIVEKINHELFSPRFSLNEKAEITHGCIVTINGKQYYSLDDKCISVGDRLLIQYLPNSKVILYCFKESD